MPEQNESKEAQREAAIFGIKNAAQTPLETFLERSRENNRLQQEHDPSSPLIMNLISEQNQGAYQKIMERFAAAQGEINQKINDGAFSDAEQLAYSMRADIQEIANAAVRSDRTILEIEACTHWCTVLSGKIRMLLRLDGNR